MMRIWWHTLREFIFIVIAIALFWLWYEATGVNDDDDAGGSNLPMSAGE